ncbi:MULTISPECIES: sulfite exporter TauE/SafE family protein [Paenibacillus]|nr:MULTISPECIES: sulfite exporter TauE/SafE family protein [Paenibacillus]MDN4068153.1 sulfite exporter TauE/SafE family protein [Paenibacillus vini]
MIMEIPSWLGFGMLVILLAGFIQGVTSFGFALVSLPLLTLFLPLRQVVPLIVILSFFTNIAIFINCYKHVVIRKIGLLTLSGIVAAPLGSYLLLYVNETALKIAAGGLIVLSSAVMMSGKTFQVTRERLGFVTVGLASGLLNGSISMSGPPVALFLSNQGTDKGAFRGNLTFYALLLNAVTIISYIYGGLLDEAVSETLVWLIPAMIAGVLLGIWAGGKLNEAVFKKLTLILILVSGCWTLWTAIKGL